MADAPVIAPSSRLGVVTPTALRHFTIWPGNAVGDKWKVLAGVIQARTGATCSLICSMPEDQAFFERSWNGVARHIQPVTGLYRVAEEPIASAIAVEREARTYEEKFDCRMIDLLQCDRHLGLAYSSGGVLYPRSRLGTRTSYHQSLRVAMRLLDFFDAYLADHKPDLMLMEGVGSLHTICLAVALRRRGIPLRCPSPSRYRNFVHWADDMYFQSAAIRREYQLRPPASDATTVQVTGPYLASAVERRRQRGKLTLRGAAQACVKDVARFSYQRLIRYRPYAGNWLRDTLAFRVRTYTRHQRLERHSFTDPSVLRGRRYVFYPLNHEPEASLSVMAPHFNHQAGIIDLVAKSLSADVGLVVKEHETIGIAARPSGFYDWLLALPNVRLASMHLNAVPLIRGSLATVVLTGTAGMEAAVLGIPVLAFGRHNLYNEIPHVHVVDSLSGVRSLLDHLCSEAHQSEGAVAARRREGTRFFEAVMACSIDLGDEQLFSATGAISSESADRLADLLFSTL